MHDLKVIENDLVPVYETNTGEKVVYGTELHNVLEVKSNYRDWIKNRLDDCEAAENEDYEAAKILAPSGQAMKQHIIKLDIAKEMAMLERNEKGKQVRRYFIAVEKKYKEAYPRVPVNPVVGLNLSPQLQAMINLELKQKEQDQKLAALADKTDRQSEVIETVRSAMIEPEKEESFSHWVSSVIENVASSPHYQDNPYRYQTAWGESYKRLAAKSGCRLELLLKNAKKRAAENGVSKSKIKLISKLSVIASDKRLKALYISVLQEMTVAYCTEVEV